MKKQKLNILILISLTLTMVLVFERQPMSGTSFSSVEESRSEIEIESKIPDVYSSNRMTQSIGKELNDQQKKSGILSR